MTVDLLLFPPRPPPPSKEDAARHPSPLGHTTSIPESDLEIFQMSPESRCCVIPPPRHTTSTPELDLHACSIGELRARLNARGILVFVRLKPDLWLATLRGCKFCSLYSLLVAVQIRLTAIYKSKKLTRWRKQKHSMLIWLFFFSGTGCGRKDHDSVQAEAGRNRHYHSYHRWSNQYISHVVVSANSSVRILGWLFHSFPIRVQCWDGGIQEHQLHCVGRRRSGQNPAALETLLPKHTGQLQGRFWFWVLCQWKNNNKIIRSRQQTWPDARFVVTVCWCMGLHCRVWSSWLTATTESESRRHKTSWARWWVRKCLVNLADRNHCRTIRL